MRDGGEPTVHRGRRRRGVTLRGESISLSARGIAATSSVAGAWGRGEGDGGSLEARGGRTATGKLAHRACPAMVVRRRAGEGRLWRGVSESRKEGSAEEEALHLTPGSEGAIRGRGTMAVRRQPCGIRRLGSRGGADGWDPPGSGPGKEKEKNVFSPLL